MTDSAALLRDYVANGSEGAFGQLVAGHLDLVYSAALRVVNGDSALAGDVAQEVFTDLARKAGSLPAGVVLSGWLYRHTCFKAANAVRAERRRQAREQEAATMQVLNEDTDGAWQRLAPVLEEAMTRLGTTDRNALVLRFFERRPLRAVGDALGISEEAARKRVNRAIAALRTQLVRRRVPVDAAVLATAISTKAVSAAPAGLSAALTSASLAGAASATAGAGQTLLEILAMTKLQAATLSLVFLAGVATPLLLNSTAATPASTPGPEPATADTGISLSAHTPSNGAPAQTPPASVGSALARLEAWLRKEDQTNPMAKDFSDDLRFLIWPLSPADYAQAWTLAQGLRSPEVRRQYELQLLTAWSRTDPRAATIAGQFVPLDPLGRWDALSEPLTGWGRQDPKAALTWARESLPEGLRLSRMRYAFGGAMETMSLPDALVTAQQMPTPGMAKAATTCLMDRWSSRDPVAAAAAVSQMPPSPLRADAFWILVHNWKEIDPAAAQRWLDQTPLTDDKKHYLRFNPHGRE